MTTVKSAGGVSLAKSTPGTADETKIVDGFTAWVNGELLTGTAVESKTVVQDVHAKLTHTFNFDGTPRAILAQFGYNGTVGKFGTFMKILDTEYKQSSGSPTQSVTFGSNYVTMTFNEAMGSAYTPYMKVTAIY